MLQDIIQNIKQGIDEQKNRMVKMSSDDFNDFIKKGFSKKDFIDFMKETYHLRNSDLKIRFNLSEDSFYFSSRYFSSSITISNKNLKAYSSYSDKEEVEYLNTQIYNFYIENVNNKYLKVKAMEELEEELSMSETPKTKRLKI